jgi:hypothetical protein
MHSPALAGFAVLSHWLPFLLFPVAVGSLADRLTHAASSSAACSSSYRHGILLITDTLEMWHDVAAGHPWLRRRAMADAEPGVAVRHRVRPSAERGAAERDGALSGHPVGPAVAASSC